VRLSAPLSQCSSLFAKRDSPIENSRAGGSEIPQLTSATAKSHHENTHADKTSEHQHPIGDAAWQDDCQEHSEQGRVAVGVWMHLGDPVQVVTLPGQSTQSGMPRSLSPWSHISGIITPSFMKPLPSRRRFCAVLHCMDSLWRLSSC